MTVKELAEKCGFTFIVNVCDKEISSCYIGDLLSWVMSRLNTGGAWITIMNNMNVLAVASLCEASCVIMAEGVEPDEAMKQEAQTRGINILSSKLDAYSTAKSISEYI